MACKQIMDDTVGPMLPSEITKAAMGYGTAPLYVNPVMNWQFCLMVLVPETAWLQNRAQWTESNLKISAQGAQRTYSKRDHWFTSPLRHHHSCACNYADSDNKHWKTAKLAIINIFVRGASHCLFSFILCRRDKTADLPATQTWETCCKVIYPH